MPRDLPVRPDRRQARRRYRGRDADVGLRLSAPRRRMAGILEIYKGAVRRLAGRCRAQDYLRDCRAALAMTGAMSLRGAELRSNLAAARFRLLVGWIGRDRVFGLEISCRR